MNVLSNRTEIFINIKKNQKFNNLHPFTDYLWICSIQENNSLDSDLLFEKLFSEFSLSLSGFVNPKINFPDSDLGFIKSGLDSFSSYLHGQVDIVIKISLMGRCDS